MSPLLQALRHRDEVHSAAMRQMSAKVDNLSQHLAQYLSVCSRGSAGSASQHSPGASPRQAVATPQRKQLQRQQGDRTKANKQKEKKENLHRQALHGEPLHLEAA